MPGWTERLQTLATTPRPEPSPRARRILLTVSFVAFAAMAVVAWRNLPADTVDGVDWALLALVPLVGVPLSLVANIGELRYQTALVGARTDLRDEVEVVFVARAASLLPLPGSAIVRTGHVARVGDSGVVVAGATAIVTGLLWLSSSLLVASVALFVLDESLAGLGASLACLAGGGLAAFLTARLPASSGQWRAFGMLVVAELFATVVSGARFWVIAIALDLDAELEQLLPLVVAGAVAAAAGIFPAGIGLREGLAGLIAPLGDLSVAVGVTVAAIDRLAGLLVQSVMALALALLRWLRPPDGMGG